MKFLRNEPLKKHNSFRIGGCADYFCSPNNLSELKEALDFALSKKIKVTFIGCGTNLLVLDKGFRGLVIKLSPGLSWLRIEGSKAWVGAGMQLPKLLAKLSHKGLSGLEFLAGIPGSVGGAVAMNAGAWKKELGSKVEKIKAISLSGKEKIFNRHQLRFGYRKSSLQNNNWIATEVLIKLRRDKRKNIMSKIAAYLKQRREKQPLGIPNCGSVFKNPKGSFAGKLIEAAGLKGIRIGDAQVSSKHANFIVNLGEAKAKDVLKLITLIQRNVRQKMEPEIKLLS